MHECSPKQKSNILIGRRPKTEEVGGQTEESVGRDSRGGEERRKGERLRGGKKKKGGEKEIPEGRINCGW